MFKKMFLKKLFFMHEVKRVCKRLYECKEVIMKERKRFIDGMMKLTLYKKLSLIAILSLIIFSGAQAESQLDELGKQLAAKGKERQEAEKKLNTAQEAEKKAEGAYNKAKKEVLARENECRRQMGLSLNRKRHRNEIPFCRTTDEKHREVSEKERIYNDKKEEFDNAKIELNRIIRELQDIERRYNLELQASERADREEDRALKAGDAIRQAIRDCKFGKAASDIERISLGRVKTMFQKELETAKRREESVRTMWDKAEDHYKKAQVKERKGNLQQARSGYEKTIDELNKAWATTMCEHRKRKIDESTKKVRSRLEALKDSSKPPVSPHRRVKRFNAPSIGGYPLDWCLTWATDCAKPAADAFCKANGFTESVKHKGPKFGFTQTKIIQTGQICKGPGCGSFHYIDCAE